MTLDDFLNHIEAGGALNTVLVVSFCVRTDSFNLTGGLYISIFADIKMIPRPVETTPTVAHFQIIFRKIPIYP